VHLNRAVTVLSVAAAIVAATAAPALAAPPTNDTIDNAIPVDVGYRAVVNTTDATTDSVDAQLNQSCGAPATDASVWYTLQPAADGAVIIDVSRSSYSAGVAVGVGTPGSLQTVACGPGTILRDAQAGQTYYVLAFDDQQDGTGNGGRLSISFMATDTPTATLAVSRSARLDDNGNAVLHGTFRCENGNPIQISGEAIQIRTFTSVRAQFATLRFGQCDGTRHSWEAVARAFGADFRTGSALVSSFGFVCGTFLCTEGFSERVVRLRPAQP